MSGRKSTAARRRLEFQQLRVFVALNERGTITAASRSLGLAQSTVSESLAALERALGTAVIVRRPASRRVLLTEAGRALLPHAQAVLETLDLAHSAVARATVTARAVVEIIANESISTYVLSQVLAPMRGRWPQTRFAVTVGTCGQVRHGVHEGEFDLGLMLEAARENERAAGARAAKRVKREVLVSHVPLVVFMSPSHPLALGAAAARARRAALADYTLFLSDAAGDFHTLVNRFLEAEGMPGPHVQATGTVEGVKRAVLADVHALGVLPAYAIDAELRRGRFARLDIRPAPPVMQLHGLVPTSRDTHPAAQELLEAIRNGHRKRR